PCQLFLKLESQNPGGSIKDRIGLYLIEAAEPAGKIKPGGTLIEATAGNTRLGLALAAAQKGYRLLLVIPDKMSQEKIFHLKAMGAEVMMTRSDVSKGHPEYYRDVAERLARETPDCHFVNQFGNPANAQAHEETTAPEIWQQMDHRLDAVVCGGGTGAPPAGLTPFFAREGIIAGTSTGTLLAAALRYCREQTRSRRVVTFACDSGNKYLSKVYNDYWMLDQGFLERERCGDLRDLIARRHSEHAAVTVN